MVVVVEWRWGRREVVQKRFIVVIFCYDWIRVKMLQLGGAVLSLGRKGSLFIHLTERLVARMMETLLVATQKPIQKIPEEKMETEPQTLAIAATTAP